MAAHRAERDDVSVGEHRDGHQYIRQVRVSPAVGVVLNEHVALFEAFQREAFQNALQRERHSREVHRNVPSALSDQFGLSGQDGARNVSSILPQRRHRGPNHDVLHFAGHGEECIADHFESDRINPGRAHSIPLGR